MRAAARRHALVASALATLVATAPAAADNRIVRGDHPTAADSTARDRPDARRAFTWVPRPGDRTDWYAVTEASFGNDTRGDWDFMSNSVGAMRNVPGHLAFGASVDGSTDGDAAVSARGRRWFANGQAVELSLGVFPDPPDHGVIGPIVTVRYAPFAWGYVQAGTAPVRELRYAGPTNAPNTTTSTRVFYGAGVAGPAGVIVFGLEVLLVGLAIAAWSGAN